MTEEPEIAVWKSVSKTVTLKSRCFQVEMTSDKGDPSVFTFASVVSFSRGFTRFDHLLEFIHGLSNELNKLANKVKDVAEKEGFLKCQKR